MGKDYKAKTQYINKPEFYTFKGHSMIKVAIKINDDTGYGEAVSMGVPKAQGMIDNIEELIKFVADHSDELKTIAPTAHLKDDDKPRSNSNLNGNSSSGSEVNEEECPF